MLSLNLVRQNGKSGKTTIFLFIHKIIEKIPLSDGNHYPCFFLDKFCFEKLFFFLKRRGKEFLDLKKLRHRTRAADR
jgi:hypothetical protein